MAIKLWFPSLISLLVNKKIYIGILTIDTVSQDDGDNNWKLICLWFGGAAGAAAAAAAVGGPLYGWLPDAGWLVGCLLA